MSTHPTIPTTYAFLDTSRGASQVQIVCQERTLATFGTHTWSWTRLGGVLSAYNMADHALMAVHPCHTWHEIEAWSVSRRVRHPIQDLWGRIWAVELTAGPMRLLCSSPSGLPELALTVM